MWVKILGFTLELAGPMDIEELYSMLEDGHGRRHDFADRERILYFVKDFDDDYHAGAVLTIKDHKKYLELVKDGRETKISVKRASENSSLMDLNFFVINKTTQRGAYSHYHQSFSVNQFGHFIGQFVREESNTVVSAEVNKIVESKFSKGKYKKLVSAARKAHTSRLFCSTIVKKDQLEVLLEELSRVSKMEYDLVSLEAPGSTYTPLSGVKKRSEKIVFDSKGNFASIKKGIVDFVKGENPTKGAIYGYDKHDHRRIIKIMDQPDYFGEHDFDEIAEKLVFDPDAVEGEDGCWGFSELINVCRKNEQIFELE